MQDLVQQVTQVLRDHALFIPPVCFAVAFLGSFLGSNLFTPTGPILASVGVLIGTGVSSWTPVLWAACGAIIGCSISYSIGKRLGPALIDMSSSPTWLNVVSKARRLFERHGPLAVLIAYFSGLTRAPTAAVAAAAGMKRVSFETTNAVSACLWAPAAFSVGIVPGMMLPSHSPWIGVAPIVIPALAIIIPLAYATLKRRPARTPADPGT